MSADQDKKTRGGSLSPVTKQIVQIGGFALLLTLIVTFLIVRPHYLKIQNEMTSEKEQLNENFQAMKRSNSLTISQLQKQKKELQQTVSDLQTAQQKANRRIQKLNGEMETLHAQIQTLEHEQTDLKTTQANLEEEKSKLEETLSELEAEKSALDDQLRQLRISSGRMTMKEKTRPMGIGDEKSDYISGTQITLHYTKGEKEKAKQIMDKLRDLGGRIQLKAHKASEVEKHSNTIYYYKGSQAEHTAHQIQTLLTDIEPIQIVESKVWWFWADMNKLNLWL